MTKLSPKLAEEIKIGAEINATEQKIIENISQTKSWFSKKINKIDKPLARLTKGKKKGLTSAQKF